MTPNRQADRQTDIGIFRAPMELKVKKMKKVEKVKIVEITIITGHEFKWTLRLWLWWRRRGLYLHRDYNVCTLKS